MSFTKRAKVAKITKFKDALLCAERALCDAALTNVLTGNSDKHFRNLIHWVREDIKRADAELLRRQEQGA